jgi:hypothetical protein
MDQTAQVFQLADRLLELRDRKNALEEEIKEVNAELERVQQELIEQMRLNGLDNFRRNGKLFIPVTKTWASPKAEFKEAVITWLKENGFGDMVKETVHSQTFNSWANEMIEQEGMLPEEIADLVSVYDKVSVQVRKG